MSGPGSMWRFAMEELVRVGPRLTWRKGGLRRIQLRFERELRGPDRLDAVGGLLRLASALRRKLASPASADALVALIRVHPDALAIAKAAFGSGRERDLRRRFTASLGEREPRRAPRMDEAPQPNTQPATRWFDPTEQDRRRARHPLPRQRS